MSKFPTAAELHQKSITVLAKRIKDKVDEYVQDIVYGLAYASSEGKFTLTVFLTSNTGGEGILDHVIYGVSIIEQNAILARLLNELTVSGFGYELVGDFEDDDRIYTSLIIKW